MTLYVRQYASTTRPLTRPIPYIAHETIFNKWTNTKIWNLKIHNKLCVFSNTHTVHTKLNVKSFLYTINASISTPPIGLIFVMNVQLYVGKTKILIFGRLIYTRFFIWHFWYNIRPCTTIKAIIWFLWKKMYWWVFVFHWMIKATWKVASWLSKTMFYW